MLDLSLVNKSWTLFLDRDGVINHEKKDDYVYNYDEFIFYKGANAALRILAGVFGNIILVTNQRGVGRGLMSEEALKEIQQKMIDDIEKTGGRIDRIYYCTAVNNDHPDRKPNPGMALRAKMDNPLIEFSKSIMVGNNLSDMEFGKNAGMYTVHVRTTHDEYTSLHPLIDQSYADLLEFANALPR